MPSAVPSSATAAQTAPRGLFDFLDQGHIELQQQLKALRQLIEAIEADSLKPAELRARCQVVLKWFSESARQHHLDEEKHIFPSLLASSNPETVHMTQRLIQDHGWLETDWLQIEPMLGAIADGLGGPDVAMLRDAFEVFEQLYLDHMVLEESQAYPAARSNILASEMTAMGVEMARRRTLREHDLAQKSA